MSGSIFAGIQRAILRVSGADVTETTPMPMRRGGSLGPPARTQVRARPQWQEHAVPANTRHIVVRNLADAVPVRVQLMVAGGNYATLPVHSVRPGEPLRMEDVTGVTQVRYCSEVAHAQMEIMTSLGTIALPAPLAHTNPPTIERITRVVRAVSGNRVLEMDAGYPRRMWHSTDSGRTYTGGHEWTASGDSPGDIPQHALITNTGAILVWVRVNNVPDDVKLYRSTDGAQTFTEVTDIFEADGVTPTPSGFLKPPYGATGSICVYGRGASTGGITGWVLLAAEYGASGDAQKGIFRSIDDGVTWVKVLEGADLVPGIRHWHTIVYDHFRRRLVAFAGDSDAQQRWVYSDDDGTTWQTMLLPDGVTKIGGHQMYRVVGAAFDSRGDVYWISDGPRQGQGIWKASIVAGTGGAADRITEPELLANLNSTGYGLLAFGDTIVAVTVLHPDNPFFDIGGIHVSMDRGATWARLPIVWDAASGAVDGTGFNRLWGPDGRGFWYVNATGLDTIGADAIGLRFRLPAGGF